MKHFSRAATLAVTSLSYLQDLNWATDYSLSTKEVPKKELCSLEIKLSFWFLQIASRLEEIGLIQVNSSILYGLTVLSCFTQLHSGKDNSFLFLSVFLLWKNPNCIIFQWPLFLTILIPERLLAEDVKSDASKYWY